MAYIISDNVLAPQKYANKQKLSKFKGKVKNSNIQIEWWESKEELVYKITASLYKVLPNSERPGWIRGTIGNTYIINNNAIIRSAFEDIIVIDGKSILEDKRAELNIEIDEQHTRSSFYICKDYPDSFKIVGSINGIETHFESDFKNVNILNERGAVKEKAHIQVLCADLDNDGRKEVVIAAGVSFNIEEVIIYSVVIGARNPFEFVGRINACGKCIIDAKTNIIQMFEGSAPMVYEYMYANKHIWKVADKHKCAPY